MPKIDISLEYLWELLEERWSLQDLEQRLEVAKAELDEFDEVQQRVKISLNDTNRPDLWSAAGLSRQLKAYFQGKILQYDFFSSQEKEHVASKSIRVESSLDTVRPYLAAFCVKGLVRGEVMLDELVQLQEKLCSNYGQKRKAVSMGLYRADKLEFPLRYYAVDPDLTEMVPLGFDSGPISLRRILQEHPKGKEFAGLLEPYALHPFFEDASGNALSYPPIINSSQNGAVSPGDRHLLVELTGTSWEAVLLSSALVACAFADMAWEIEPIEVFYDTPSPLGKSLVFPRIFQVEQAFCHDDIKRVLGLTLSDDEMKSAFRRMGLDQLRRQDETFFLLPPPYRNDFLHPVDIAEELMIGHSLALFKPQELFDHTIGTLLPMTQWADKWRSLLVGLGFQEMMYTYLGSEKELVSFMLEDVRDFMAIANPMSENYAYLRRSIFPSLLKSESLSSHQMYPHKIFEIAPVVHPDAQSPEGSRTQTSCAFLAASGSEDFNTVMATVRALFYYLERDFTLEKVSDPRFLPGRGASIIFQGKVIGIFGETHPQVLSLWGITMPCVMAEFCLDKLLFLD